MTNVPLGACEIELHCEGGLIVELHSIDYNQLQVTHLDVGVIKGIAQIKCLTMKSAKLNLTESTKC